jgi:hypothetical protein
MAPDDVEEIERSSLDQVVGGICESEGQIWETAGDEHARAIRAYTRNPTDENKAAEGAAQAAVKRGWQAFEKCRQTGGS